MKAIIVSFLFVAFLLFSSCTSYASEVADPAPAPPPVKTTRTTSLADNTSSDVTNTIASVENTLGASTTPTIDLLRIGFLF